MVKKRTHDTLIIHVPLDWKPRIELLKRDGESVAEFVRSVLRPILNGEIGIVRQEDGTATHVEMIPSYADGPRPPHRLLVRQNGQIQPVSGFQKRGPKKQRKE